MSIETATPKRRGLKLAIATVLSCALLVASYEAVVSSSQRTTTEAREGSELLFRVKLVKVLDFASYATGMAWSPDGKHVATAEKMDSVVKIWNVKTWQVEHTITKRTHGSFVQLFSADGKLLLTSSTEIGFGSRAALSIVEVATGRIVRQVMGPRDSSHWTFANLPIQFALSRDGSRLFVAYYSTSPHRDDTLYVYDTNSWHVVTHWTPPFGPRTLMAGLGERDVITSNTKGVVQSWYADQGRLLNEFKVGSKSLHTTDVNLRGPYLAAGGSDGWISIWDLRSGRRLAAIPSEPRIMSVAFSSSGKYLVADSTALGGVHDLRGRFRRGFSVYRTIDLKELQLVHEFSDERWSVSFSPDNRYLALAGDSEVRIYSFEEENGNGR